MQRSQEDGVAPEGLIVQAIDDPPLGSQFPLAVQPACCFVDPKVWAFEGTVTGQGSLLGFG